MDFMQYMPILMVFMQNIRKNNFFLKKEKG